MILAEFSIEKSKLFQEIPRLEQQWYLSFDIKPNETIAHHGTILHATQGSSSQRIPSINFFSNTLKLYICMYLNRGTNCFVDDKPLSTSFFNNIKLMQTWDVKRKKYVYRVYVNDELKRMVDNDAPGVFTNVKVYTADPWRTPANAMMKNLVFVNIPNG